MSFLTTSLAGKWEDEDEAHFRAEDEASQRAAAARESRWSNSLQLVVMVTAKIGGESVFGSGIIVGFGVNRIYIVTANHIVRRGAQQATNINLLLRTNVDHPLNATLEKQYDASEDLALLTVDGLKEAGIDCKHFRLNQIGDLKKLKRSEPNSFYFSGGGDVYPVGNPNGVAWGYPVTPDKVSEVLGNNITFQSSFITVGHSGGALLNGLGLLVGMIQKDAPPFGVARSLTDIITKVRSWDIPVDLVPNESKNDKFGSC